MQMQVLVGTPRHTNDVTITLRCQLQAMQMAAELVDGLRVYFLISQGISEGWLSGGLDLSCVMPRDTVSLHPFVVELFTSPFYLVNY
jgi:hypothetical protein